MVLLIRFYGIGTLHTVTHLHSTMVLLIQIWGTLCLLTCMIYIPLWFFSYVLDGDGKAFTVAIYIPLWFFSYLNVLLIFMSADNIYIPLWFFSYFECFVNIYEC